MRVTIFHAPCTQEVEMGTGSVALDVVYQQLAKSKLEAGTQVGRV